MTHTQTVMLRLLTMCIPFRNLRKKWRTFLRDFLSDYDRDARRSMRAWRRHPVAGRTILILEPNYCHGEVIPGFCRHLLDMGYCVDVLMHHSLARQSPLCCFKEGDIHIFTAMCTSWKRLAKARVLTRYEAILISTSAFYDTPGWASFLHMTGLDKFANLLAVEHELKDIPRFGEEELDRQGRLLTLGSFPRGMMVNPHFFGEIPPAPRNREPVFITVGSLSAQRKNHELLVEALETVCNEGYRNFSVIIVGEGELGKIPGHLRPFLHVAGKLFCDRFPPDKIPALPTCGIFLRREFPLKNNLEFPEGIHPCEDGLFSHFVLALTEKISFCPEAVYHYRQHEQGNHHQIRKRTADILPMIPRWLSLIEEFYEQRHLWKRKAGHLVRFIEHEPFELRLLGMPFSPPEQEILYSIIRDFLNAHCTAAECRRASLHLPFRLLLKSSGFSDFGRRLRRAGKNTGIRRKLLHFCPVPSWRRNGRARLRQVREQLEEIRRNITF